MEFGSTYPTLTYNINKNEQVVKMIVPYYEKNLPEQACERIL